jgi:uncharacterized protein
MTVIDELLTWVRATCSDAPVKEAIIGLHWTAVLSHVLGLAATQEEASCCYAEELEGGGSLHTYSAYQLIERLRSNRPLDTSIGMAALNSLIKVNEDETVELNARDMLLERGRGKTVALIGHFPFSDAIRQVARQTFVLELQPSAGDLPADLAPDLLPQADVIGLTATTLLNKTFEDLHTLFPPHALVVMLGPSTPLSPILFDHGVDVLAGSLVIDPYPLLHAVGQASPLHWPKGLRRYTLIREKSLSKIQ